MVQSRRRPARRRGAACLQPLPPGLRPRHPLSAVTLSRPTKTNHVEQSGMLLKLHEPGLCLNSLHLCVALLVRTLLETN